MSLPKPGREDITFANTIIVKGVWVDARAVSVSVDKLGDIVSFHGLLYGILIHIHNIHIGLAGVKLAPDTVPSGQPLPQPQRFGESPFAPLGGSDSSADLLIVEIVAAQEVPVHEQGRIAG